MEGPKSLVISKEIGAAARAKVKAGIGSSVIVRVCVAPGAEPHAETTRTSAVADTAYVAVRV